MMRMPEHGKKISEALKGKTHSEERKQKISQTLKEKFESGELEPAFRGKNHSEETKKHQSEMMMGRQKGSKNGTFKGYYVTPWGTFESIASAVDSADCEIVSGTLYNYCKKSDKQITGFAYKISLYLKSKYTPEEVIGKTYKELGFDFVSEK